MSQKMRDFIICETYTKVELNKMSHIPHSDIPLL